MNSLERLKQHPAIATSIALTGVYGVVAVIFLNLSAEHSRLQETRITEYKERLEEKEDLREKYYEETKKSMAAELQMIEIEKALDITQNKLTALTEAGWEERFHTEQAARRAAEEELRLAEIRYKSTLASVNDKREELATENAGLALKLNGLPEVRNAKMTDTVKAFDDLLQQKAEDIAATRELQAQLEQKERTIAELQDKLKVARDENLALRNVVEKGKIPYSTDIDKQNLSVAILATSLTKIRDDYNCLVTLLNGVPSIKGGVSGTEFSQLLKSARISDDYYCCVAVTRCAKFLKPPITESDVASILSSISDSYYNALASQALVKAANK